MGIKHVFKNPLIFYLFIAVLIYAVVRLSISFFTTNIMGGIIDENVNNNNFKEGYICFYDYRPKTGSKSKGSYGDRAYFYYFYIDGKISQNIMRPYFPFREQWNVFIKNMDRSKCYQATYVEAQFLFFKQRRIYKVFKKTIPNSYPSPYFKGEK
ncbi:hypothetical protein [Acinetobacter junii]|uniref:hypothetical protein n=1 Tax=Acinetobacter junii TaxID=40215 RepID=UPI00143A21E6|nr:hypothetical protein [Acinetobacter junii]NKG33860.1 hypothetical protein [Acinetobacter junii]